MSPELNGNENPPNVIKRKKKKNLSMQSASSSDALNSCFLNGYDNEYGTYDGEFCDNRPEFMTYDCHKRGCIRPVPPGTQPTSLPAYSNKCPGYIRYPSYQVYPPPPSFRTPSQPPFMGQHRYPHFMPGPMSGNLPGPAPVPQAQWNRLPTAIGSNSHYFPTGLELSNDYTSLPPMNFNIEPSNRRLSDPGLPHESDSCSNSSFDSEKNYQKLVEEMQSLKEYNKKLSREVSDLRMEIGMLRQSQNSRNLDREYEPGMLADIIRELREAARVREDALLARMKHVLEEKYLNLNEVSMNNDVKNKNSDRISNLEEQLKNLAAVTRNSRTEGAPLLALTPHSTASTPIGDKSKSARQVLELEREALDLRRELQDTRAKKEEADQKVIQLSKMLQRTEIFTSDVLSSCEDGKTSVDSMSTVTTPSSLPPVPPRVILSGPVTDL